MSKTHYVYTWNGTILIHSTLISPEKQCFDMHSHTEYELLFLLKGDVTEVIESRKYKLKRHDLVLIRPNNYHFIQVDSPEDYERCVIIFDPSEFNVDNLDLLDDRLELWNCRHTPMIIDLFKRMDYYASVMTKDDLKDMLGLLIKELIYNLSFANGNRAEPTESVHPVVSQALAEINRNLLSIKNIAQIADKLFVTESYLYRIFKRELKTTPYKYITEKRLQAARSMIQQGKSPTKIYQECGFNDYTSFYRSYTKFFGHAPSNTK